MGRGGKKKAKKIEKIKNTNPLNDESGSNSNEASANEETLRLTSESNDEELYNNLLELIKKLISQITDNLIVVEEWIIDFEIADEDVSDVKKMNTDKDNENNSKEKTCSDEELLKLIKKFEELIKNKLLEYFFEDQNLDDNKSESEEKNNLSIINEAKEEDINQQIEDLKKKINECIETLKQSDIIKNNADYKTLLENFTDFLGKNSRNENIQLSGKTIITDFTFSPLTNSYLENNNSATDNKYGAVNHDNHFRLDFNGKIYENDTTIPMYENLTSQ